VLKLSHCKKCVAEFFLFPEYLGETISLILNGFRGVTYLIMCTFYWLSLYMPVLWSCWCYFLLSRIARMLISAIHEWNFVFYMPKIIFLHAIFY